MASQSIDYLERRCLINYGCTYKDALALNGGVVLSSKTSMARCYRQQERNALTRGIPWELNFPEWVEIWTKSGHWAERGLTRGKFCMARHGDAGAYSPDNVSIVTSVENSVFAFSHRKRIGRPAGKGRGWTLSSGKYQVTFRRKYVGLFSTADEALAAYRSAVRMHEESLSVR